MIKSNCYEIMRVKKKSSLVFSNPDALILIKKKHVFGQIMSNSNITESSQYNNNNMQYG